VLAGLLSVCDALITMLKFGATDNAGSIAHVFSESFSSEILAPIVNTETLIEGNREVGDGRMIPDRA
jgi:hypothetical protein